MDPGGTASLERWNVLGVEQYDGPDSLPAGGLGSGGMDRGSALGGGWAGLPTSMPATSMAGQILPFDKSAVDYLREMQAQLTGGSSMSQQQQQQQQPPPPGLGEHGLSPGSFAAMFGSRLNLQDTVIQEGDEDAEAGDDTLPQHSRLRSSEGASSRASLPDVPSSDRLMEGPKRPQSVDDADVFGALNGLELNHHPQEADRAGSGAFSQPRLVPAGQQMPAAGGHGRAGGAPGHIPDGENISRTLFVRNIDSSVLDEELYGLFEAYGEIRTLYTACKHRGFVVISYYDLRAACLSVHMLNGTSLKGRSLDIQVSPQESDREDHQGRVLVFVTDPSLTVDEVYRVFAGFGDIKVIEDLPTKPNHKLVEYYDVRHAQAALKTLNRADVAKKLIVFEASAATTGVMKAQDGWPAQQGSGMEPRPAQQSLSHVMSGNELANEQLLGEAQARGLLRNMSEGSLAHMGGSMQDLLQLAGGLGMGGPGVNHQEQLLNQATQAGLLSQQGSRMSMGSSLSTSNLAQLQQLHANAAGSGAEGLPYLGGAGGMMASAAGQDPRYVNEAMQAGLLQRPHNIALSMSTGDLSALGAGPRMPQTSQPAGQLRGIASTGNLWSAAQQVLAQQAGGGAHSAWSGSMPNLQAASQPGALPSWQQLQEAAAMQNQQALQGLGLAGLQSTGGMEPLLQNAGNLLGAGQLSAAQQLLQQAVSLQAAQGGSFPMGSMRVPKGIVGGRGNKDRREEGGLGGPGGRLSRRNLDPVAEAERKAQQEKLYALDMEKILSGQDKRTTLMVKNIPNKYTQKMLLGTIDDKFKGTYDFFYLPIDFKNKCNVGYAFINLIRPEYIVPLVERFNNKKWEKFNSEKVCHISYARIQGKNALVAHFQNSSLLHEDKRCRPILFHSDGPFAGDQEPFPMRPNPRLAKSNSRGSMTQLVGAGGGPKREGW